VDVDACNVLGDCGGAFPLRTGSSEADLRAPLPRGPQGAVRFLGGAPRGGVSRPRRRERIDEQGRSGGQPCVLAPDVEGATRSSGNEQARNARPDPRGLPSSKARRDQRPNRSAFHRIELGTRRARRTDTRSSAASAYWRDRPFAPGGRAEARPPVRG